MINKETKAYQNKIKYIKEYKNKKSRNVCFTYSREYDKEMLEWLDAQPNKADYIRQLILADKAARTGE